METTTTVTNDGGLGILTGFIESLIADHAFTTFSGSQLVDKGQQILAGSDKGTLRGKRYSYLGDYTEVPIDLAKTDLTDVDLWEEITLTDIESLIPPGVNLNVTKSDATAVGLLFSVNDVQSGVTARIGASDVDVADGFVLVSAIENAGIVATNIGSVKADGGSFFAPDSKVLAVNANVATNNVTSFSVAEVSDSSVDVQDIADTTGGANPNAAINIAGRDAELDDKDVIVTPATNRTITPDDGNLIVQSDNTAFIHASLDTSTIAEGGGGKTIAVGAAIAFNSVGIDGQNILFNLADTFIGTTVATPNPSTSTARVARSTVDVARDIIVDADNNITITSEIVNSAIVTGLSIADKSDAVSVGAIIAMNRTASDTSAAIVAAHRVVAQVGSVQVTADDASVIDAAVTATSVSAAVGQSGSKSVSIAASFARNEITSNASAAILNSDVDAETDLSITAKRDAIITARGLSAAVGVGLTAGGGKSGDVSFSGGGAVGFNSVRGQTRALSTDSTLNAAGIITLDATSGSNINATVLAASATGAINLGSSGATAVGIGAVYVDNMIGYSQTTPTLSGTQLDSNAVVSSIPVAGNFYVTGASNSAIVGQTYKFVGNADRVVQDTDGNEIPDGVDLAIEDYSDKNLWQRVDFVKGTDVSSYAALNNVDIANMMNDTAPASLSVSALAAQTINATAAAGAVALSGSLKGAKTIAGGAAAARNRIAGGATAEITDTRSKMTAGDVTVLARDASTINSLVGAAAVGVAVSGKTALSLSIGIALAFNDVANQVSARIVGSDVTATGSNGVSVDAQTAAPEALNIDATTDVTTAKLNDLAVADINETVEGEPDTAEVDVADEAADMDVLTALVGLIDDEISDDDNSVAGTVTSLSDLVFTTSEDGNGWTLIDGLGRKFTLISNENGTSFDVEIGTINVVSGAAALSAAVGKSGISIAGAGAYSENVVQSTTSAYIDDAIVTALVGSIDVDAYNKSAINAITVAAAIALGIGKTGAGISIGASISQNLIGREARDTGDPVGTYAYIQNSKVSAEFGNINVLAKSEQNINALNVAGAVAIAAGKTGVAISGSGVYVRNVIDVETSAKIIGDVEDDATAAVEGANVTIKAENMSQINAIAATVSISAALGLSTGVAIAVGVTVAQNEIYGLTTAQVLNSDDGGVSSTVGDITVEASDSARINSAAAAASVAFGAGKTGISLGLAGALAFNRIGSGVLATIKNSLINSANDVNILATASGRIDAINAAVAASIAAGKTGVGIAVGAAFVSNQIGYGYGSLLDSEATFRTSDTSGTLFDVNEVVKGNTVRVTDGIHAGRTFSYISDDDVAANVDTTGNNELDKVDLAAIDYNNPNQWVEINLVKNTVQIQAGAIDSYITALGDLMIDAQSDQKINAASLAVAAGIGLGVTGVAFTLSGAVVLNRISTSPTAVISGRLDAGNDANISANTVTVQADDESSINAASIAGAVSVAAGKTGVAIALGVSLAFNDVENNVNATIDSDANVLAQGEATENFIIVRAGSATQDVASDLDLGSIVDSQFAYDAADLLDRNGIYDSYTLATTDVEATTTLLANAAIYPTTNLNDLMMLLELEDKDHNIVGNDLDVRIIDAGERWSVEDERGTVWNISLEEGILLGSNELIVQRSTSFDVLKKLETALKNEEYSVEGSLRMNTILEQELWVAVDESGTAWNILLEDGQFKAHRVTINAVSAAVSLAAGLGFSGIAIAGAGAFARNVTMSNVDAHIESATVATDAGNLSVLADSESLINAAVLSASISLSIGLTVGVGAAIGISVAENQIGGSLAESVTTAYVKDSLVTAGGDLLVEAETAQTINALVFAGSVALAAGSSTGVGFAGSGVYVHNEIEGNTIAKIEGGSAATTGYEISANNVTVRATTDSEINVAAAAVAIAAAFGSTGLGVSIGVSIAENEIDGLTQAIITGADAHATSGDVTVEARDNASINALAAAAGLAAGFGLSTGIGVSLAGALAFNRIGSGVSATIIHSRVHAQDVSGSGGDVTVTALSEGSVNALIISASVAIGVGATGIGVGIGAAYANNMIGHEYSQSLTTYTSGQTIGNAVLIKGNTVRVTEGMNKNRTFEYIGDTGLAPNQDNKNSLGLSIPDEAIDEFDDIPLIGVDYNNIEQWKEIEIARQPVEVKASIESSSINADGDLFVEAKSKQKIQAATLAVAAAIAGGVSFGVAVSLTGSIVQNRIATNALAFIDGSGTDGISANTITVQADDDSTINTAAIAASISLAFGPIGVAISIGVSVAMNTVENDTEAFITNTTDLVARGQTNDGDGVVVRAGSAAENGVMPLEVGYLPDDLLNNDDELLDFWPDMNDAAGTDLIEINDIETVVEIDFAQDKLVLDALKAAMTGKSIDVVGKLRLSTVESGKRWVVVDEGGSAWNLIYVSDTGYSIQKTTINALAGAASLALGVGVVGVAVAGAGAYGVNVVNSSTKAHITDASVKTLTGDVRVDAASQSQINAAVLSTALAVGVGKLGVGVAIGVSVARNFIGYDATGAFIETELSPLTQALITNSSITSFGSVEVTASSKKSVNALVFAGSAALSVGLVGVSVAGSGVYAENAIGGTTHAGINMGGTKNVSGDSVKIEATDTSKIEAIAAAVSVSLAFGFVGVAVSLAGSIAENDIATTLLADVTENSSTTGKLIATGGDVTVNAEDVALIRVISAAASVAISAGLVAVSVSGAGALAFNKIANKVSSEVIGATIEATRATRLVDSGSQIVARAGSGSQIFNSNGTLKTAYTGAYTLARDPFGAVVIKDSQGALVPVIGPTVDNDEVFLVNSIAGAPALTELKLKSEEITRTLSPGFGQPDVSDTYVKFTFLPLGDADVTSDFISVWVPDASVEKTNGDLLKAVVPVLVPLLVPGTPTAQDISITATGNATIEAAIISAAVSMGIGAVGVGVGIGTSYAKNEIGRGDQSGVFAKVDRATLGANNNITVEAKMTSSIDAFVGSFAVALAAGFVGVSGAGAGAFAVNTIDYAVISEVNSSGLTAGGKVAVTAEDMATIDATVLSASLALAVGVNAFAGAVAVSTAFNTVDNTIEASVNVSDVTATNMDVIAIDDTNVTVEARAAALSASIGFGAALSGGGALAEIIATSTVTAEITGIGDSNKIWMPKSKCLASRQALLVLLLAARLQKSKPLLTETQKASRLMLVVSIWTLVS
jgi:hypothetical protein